MKKKDSPSMDALVKNNVLAPTANAKAKADMELEAIQHQKEQETQAVQEKVAEQLAAKVIADEKRQAEKERIAEKKLMRRDQRSIKVDKLTLVRLDLVKKIKKQSGVVRPSVDDILYEAVVDYLDRYYPETRATAEMLEAL